MELANVMLANFLLLVCFVLFSVIGGLIACKKAVGKKVCNFALLLVSFFACVITLSSGALDFLGDMIGEMVGLNGENLSLGNLPNALINFSIRVIVFDIVFWIVYAVLKIVTAIVLAIFRISKTALFKKPETAGAKVVSGVFGGLTAWFWCLFSLIPIFAFTWIATPALAAADNKKYDQTYAYEVAEEINGKYSFLTENSTLCQFASLTGAKQLVEFALNSFGQTQIEINGVKTTSNVYSMMKDVARVGADAAIVYELSLSSGNTYGDLDLLVEVLDICEHSPEISTLAASFIKTMVPQNGGDQSQAEGDLVSELLPTILGAFEGEGGGKNMQNDLRAIKNILSDFIEHNKDKDFSLELMSQDLMDYIMDDKGLESLFNNLASLSSFKDVTVVLSNFGVSAICDMLVLPGSQQDVYENLINNLVTEVHEGVVSTNLNYDEVENFLEYLSDNDKTVQQYINEFGEDVAVQYYNAHLELTEKIFGVFKDAKIQAFDDKMVFVGNNANYVYDSQTDKWQTVVDLSECNSVYHLIKYLIQEVQQNNELTAQILLSHLQAYVSKNQSSTGYIVYNTNFAQKLLSPNAQELLMPDAFETQLMTKEIIVSKVKADANPENPAQSLKGLIKAATKVLDLATESEGEMTDLLLANFGQVGVVLDALYQYEITTDIPEVLLKAISEVKEFAEYLDYNAISDLTENVKAGDTTYEDFFKTVEALYKVANGLIQP